MIIEMRTYKNKTGIAVQRFREVFLSKSVPRSQGDREGSWGHSVLSMTPTHFFHARISPIWRHAKPMNAEFYELYLVSPPPVSPLPFFLDPFRYL